MNKAIFTVALAATSFLSHAVKMINDEQLVAAEVAAEYDLALAMESWIR